MKLRLEFLDDVDRNTAKVNGNVLQYDSSVGSFIGTSFIDNAGNVAIAVTNIAPLNPLEGNLWYDLDIGRTLFTIQMKMVRNGLMQILLVPLTLLKKILFMLQKTEVIVIMEHLQVQN